MDDLASALEKARRSEMGGKEYLPLALLLIS